MISLKTKVSVYQEVEVNIETPAFFKALVGLVAVISEDNVYKVYHNDTYTSIQNGTLETMKSEIEYMKDENRITEEEFMKLYNQALKMVTLKPVMEYYAGENGIETVVKHI